MDLVNEGVYVRSTQGFQIAINVTALRDSEKVPDFLQHPIYELLWKLPCEKRKENRPSTCKK